MGLLDICSSPKIEFSIQYIIALESSIVVIPDQIDLE